MKVFLRFALILAAALPLAASSVLPIDFERLSQAANHVIGGRITDITSQQDDRGYIYSTVTISVAQAIPEQYLGQDYQFRMIGGEVEGKRQYIADYPTFRVGDTIVLFLASETASVFGPTVGLWQGVFFVEADPSGAQTVTDHLRRPIVGVSNKQLLRGVKRQAGAAGPALTAGSLAGLGMAEFLDQVRSHRSQ